MLETFRPHLAQVRCSLSPMGRLAVIFALALTLPGSLMAAEGWTEFRGPNGTGIAPEADPPETWSESENVAWKTAIHGKGWSSPVVADGKVWLTTASEDGKEMFIVCVDAESGKILHDKLLFTNDEPREIHVTNSYASCTPVIEGDRIYVHFGSYGTCCLNTQTLEKYWERRDFPCHHWRGPGSSPIIYQNMLFVHYDGFDYQYIVALDKQTGETIWKKDRPDLFETDDGDQKKAYGTPAIFEIGGQDVLISPYAKATMAYDPQTGEELWYVRYEQHSTANRPLFDGKSIFIGTGFGKGSLIAINPEGAEGNVTESHVRWEQKRTMPSKPSQLLIDGRIYTIADKIGLASCLDASTGELLWQERIGGTFSASPIYAGGHIYFCDEDGKTTVVAPGETLTIVAENQLDQGCMATPAPVGKALFLRTKTDLYRLQATP
ncbi:outer membrane protein assembly factor BamB family protein [Rubinisphaera margarita]|uniref:outer membrane protein assembly factor BamB family protein n=1 Tax=Rubinisphaera margarita TaxID=2909586 RepID=UPI001EE7F6FD|nr:PQQ-binding-like beta-propeller repeat protein [Rubinisphaera margarita]MCG6157089.1 PQQ-binding-like beta-propeller repeat protein [Rubinisphaera margarita]